MRALWSGRQNCSQNFSRRVRTCLRKLDVSRAFLIHNSGVATLKVRKVAFNALNKGSGALGLVKSSCRPLWGPPLENSMIFVLYQQV